MQCPVEILHIFIVGVVLVSGHSGGPLPGGASCKDNSACYSHLCYINGVCAPDGPVEGTVAGGGACGTNADCFSNYCFEKVCAADSPVRGKVAGGGLCFDSEQCYSSSCINRRCGPDSPAPGKMAAGAQCEHPSQCYSGFCLNQRCAPDGREQGRNPGGGYCGSDAQCSSGICKDYRCSPESEVENNKVADGGQCNWDENCQSTSHCLHGLCTSRNGQQVWSYDQERKLPPGAMCTAMTMTDCETACVFGRCATPSRANPMAAADGSICDEQPTTQGQCKSGQCLSRICTVSYSDRVWISATAAGAPCTNHQTCYSGYCSFPTCSSDSAAPLSGQTPRHRGQVPGGGLCQHDADCYSGYCESHRMCGPDGPVKGALASGAVCTTDSQCFSRYCFQRRCVAVAMEGTGQQGKVAPGARCGAMDACHSASHCADTYCKALDSDGNSVWANLALTRPSLGSVGWNGSCWHTAQCSVGQCLQHRCTVPWYLLSKYSSGPDMRTVNIGILLLSVLASTVFMLSTRF